MRIFYAGSLSIFLLLGVLSCEANQNSSSAAPVASPAEGTAASSGGETVATIGGAPVTDQEMEKGLDGRAKGALIKAKVEFYQAKKDALDDYLFKRLVAEQAKKSGKTSDQVMNEQLTSKIKKSSDKDVQAFYNDAKKKYESQGRQIPPMDDRVKEMIRQQLDQGKQEERKAAFFDELKRKYRVKYELSQPRMEVAVGGNPVLGPAGAAVTVVIFSDFQCPFCKRAEETLLKVKKEYKGKVKFYFRDYPLPFHDKARPAAMAARCAGEQGKFWEYHDKLFEKQQLGPEDLVKHAKDLNLDAGKFEACVKADKYKDEIAKDMEAGADAGVTGTPAFFINGVPLSGALPFDQFKKVIDEELARPKSGKKVSL